MKRKCSKPLKFENRLFYTYSIILVVVLFFISILAYFALYIQSYNSNKSNHYQILSRIEQQADITIADMDKSIMTLALNKQFRDIIGSGSEQKMNYVTNNKTILNIFVTLDAPHFEYYRIIAFNKYAYYDFSQSGEVPSLIEKSINNYPWMDALVDSAPKYIVIPPHYDVFSNSDVWVYSVARKLSVPNNESDTIIEIQYAYDMLESLFDIDEDVGRLLVLTETGDVVYPISDNTADANKYYTAYKNRDDDSDTLRVDRKNIYWSKSDTSNWITFIIPNTKSFTLLAVTMGVYFILTFIVLSILILIISRISTKRLVQPLQDLNKSIQDVSLDNMVLSINNAESLDEIEFINRSFQDMFKQLDKSIALSVQAQANEERANYLALEAQMNPHTIYNTISMIESVSYMNGDKEVSELCICFSQMLRYISDYTAKDYYLSDEVAHLSNYAQLMEKRYDGLLKIVIEQDDNIDDFALPKFTLQPLVENCINHGMPSTSQLFVINVNVIKSDNGYKVYVIDNGTGFSKEKLEEISKEFKQYRAKSIKDVKAINMKIGNLAIKNIYFRLKMMYGNNVEFNISNNENNIGSCIEIILKSLEKSI